MITEPSWNADILNVSWVKQKGFCEELSFEALSWKSQHTEFGKGVKEMGYG
jgi:hypothetical protein